MRGGLVGRQPVQPQMCHLVSAVQPGEQGRDRVPVAHVVGTIGADQHQAQRQVGDPLEERDALRVGPVQVFEDQDGLRVTGQLGDHAQGGVQALHRAQGRIGQFGQRIRIHECGSGGIGERAGVGAVERVQQHFVGASQRARLGLPDEDARRLRRTLDGGRTGHG